MLHDEIGLRAQNRDTILKINNEHNWTWPMASFEEEENRDFDI